MEGSGGDGRGEDDGAFENGRAAGAEEEEADGEEEEEGGDEAGEGAEDGAEDHPPKADIVGEFGRLGKGRSRRRLGVRNLREGMDGEQGEEDEAQGFARVLAAHRETAKRPARRKSSRQQASPRSNFYH